MDGRLEEQAAVRLDGHAKDQRSNAAAELHSMARRAGARPGARWTDQRCRQSLIGKGGTPVDFPKTCLIRTGRSSRTALRTTVQCCAIAYDTIRTKALLRPD